MRRINYKLIALIALTGGIFCCQVAVLLVNYSGIPSFLLLLFPIPIIFLIFCSYFYSASLGKKGLYFKIFGVTLLIISLLNIWSLYQRDWLAKNWDVAGRERMRRLALQIDSRFSHLLEQLKRRGELLSQDEALRRRLLIRDKELSEKGIFDFLEQVERMSEVSDPYLALIIYDREGPVAWQGKTSFLPSNPSTILQEGRATFFIDKDMISARLNALFPILSAPGDGAVGYLHLQYLISAHYGIKNRFLRERELLLPEGLGAEGKVDINFIDYRESAQELELLFQRYGRFYWSRPEFRIENLRYPLYSPEKSILAVVTIRGVDALGQLEESKGALKTISSLGIIFLLFTLLYLSGKAFFKEMSHLSGQDFPRGLKRGGVRLLVFSLLLWSTRWLISRLNFPLEAKEFNSFNPTHFASTSFFGFLRSPADYGLTALFLVVNSLLVLYLMLRLYSRLRSSVRKGNDLCPRKIPLLSMLLHTMAVSIMAAGLLVAINRLIYITQFNSSLNLLRFSLYPVDLSRLLVQGGLQLFGFAHVALIASLFLSLWLRLGYIRGGDIRRASSGYLLLGFGLPLLWLLLIARGMELLLLPSFAVLIGVGVLIIFLERWRHWFWQRGVFLRALSLFVLFCMVTLFLYSSYFHYLDRIRRDFIERSTLPRLIYQEEREKVILKHSFSRVESYQPLIDNLRYDSGRSLGGLAYSMWQRMGLASSGYNSSLAIYDSNGKLRDQFSFNLTPISNLSLPDFKDYKEAVIIERRAQIGSQQTTLLQGTKTILDRNEPLGAVLVSLSIDYNNLPFIHSNDPYYELFRSSRAEASEETMFNTDLFLIVYDSNGRTTFTSEGKLLPPSEGVIHEVLLTGHPRWLRAEEKGGRYSVVYFPYDNYCLAVGFLETGSRDFLFALAGAFGLSAVLFILVGIGVAPFWLVRHYREVLWIFSLRGILASFHRKLLIIFIVISIVPMVFLSISIRNYLSERLRDQIRSQGIASGEVAKRVVEDYLYGQEAEGKPLRASLGDELALRVSSWINRDINIFLEGALVGTNRRELFSSGLLPLRVEGKTYHQVQLHQIPYFATQESLGDFRYTVVSAPVKLKGEGTNTILSIPLMLEQRQIELEIADINNVILISTIILIILSSLFSYSVARKISEPIKGLTRGTAQVSRGDFDLTITTTSKDEIRELVESFNKMTRDLKRQRLELQQGKDYIEKILLNATTGVISLDREGVITTINPAAIAILGIKGGDLVGRSFSQVVASEPGLSPLIESYLLYKRRPRGELKREVKFVRKAEELNARLKFIPLRSPGGEIGGAIILVEDITEVIKSNRLAAWAEMARMVAHEIKNPLTPIQLSVEHLQRIVEDQPSNYREIFNSCIETIMKQIKTLRLLSTEFSIYGRIPKLRLTAVNLREQIDEIISSYQSAISSTIDIVIDIPPDLPPIKADRELFKRALINIIENSLQAMPQGGTLSISAGLCTPRRGKKIMKVEVRDTGVGIDREAMGRLFEPYFSTKDSGVGLGLAITKKAIDDHKGEIKIRSRKGKGTTVSIFIPLTED
ncbi:hypothetical protein CEE39_09305 [bacterium (candidate division B38) B3_B38]|nr:MAG: hypothetical protein CEE39_09305 [bacterium (candidate division B38) B3_B38]